MITVDDRRIEIFINNKVDMMPLIITVDDKDGKTISELTKKLTDRPFILACIKDISWMDELSPWPTKALSNREDSPKGDADSFLTYIITKAMPAIKTYLLEKHDVTIDRYFIAGYSMAGLFALYSTYKSDIFTGFISASGSLWYEGLLDFIKTHAISKKIRYAYFSLGNKEAHTKNKLLSTVEERTEKIVAHLKDQDIETIFEMNDGGHFKDTKLRLAKGIAWILNMRT